MSEASDLDSAIRILKSRGWFSQRSKDVQKRLAAIARLRNFGTNEPVYSVGEAPNGVFGLIRGSLNISFPRSDGEDYVMHRAGQGFWVGDLALFSQGVRLVSIQAAEPTTMVQLPAIELGKLVREDPRLHADFYAMTYDNFRTAFQIITNLAMSSVAKRVADRLLLETAACPDPEGWISMSQSELAQLVAVSVPTLERVIRQFATAGLVEKGYRRIRVIDREGLQRVCMT
jgi:CRP/FNR family transcriptional regulator, cyclic AMP receptor protein